MAKTQHDVLQALAGDSEQFMAALHGVCFLSEKTDSQNQARGFVFTAFRNNISVAINWLIKVFIKIIKAYNIL